MSPGATSTTPLKFTAIINMSLLCGAMLSTHWQERQSVSITSVPAPTASRFPQMEKRCTGQPLAQAIFTAFQQLAYVTIRWHLRYRLRPPSALVASKVLQTAWKVIRMVLFTWEISNKMPSTPSTLRQACSAYLYGIRASHGPIRCTLQLTVICISLRISSGERLRIFLVRIGERGLSRSFG